MLAECIAAVVLQTVRDALAKYEEQATGRALEGGERLAWIVVDLSPVSEIDATAVHFWFAPTRKPAWQLSPLIVLLRWLLPLEL